MTKPVRPSSSRWRAFLNLHFGIAVDIGRRLVQHQYFLHQPPGRGQNSKAGVAQGSDCRASFGQHRVIALRQGFDEFMCTHGNSSLNHRLVVGPIGSIANVFTHRAGVKR